MKQSEYLKNHQKFIFSSWSNLNMCGEPFYVFYKWSHCSFVPANKIHIFEHYSRLSNLSLFQLVLRFFVQNKEFTKITFKINNSIKSHINFSQYWKNGIFDTKVMFINRNNNIFWDYFLFPWTSTLTFS